MIKYFTIAFIFTLISCNQNQVIIIDEKLSDEQTLKSLDVNEIFIKDNYYPGQAPKQYSEFVDNSIVLVRTKKFENEKQIQRKNLLNNTIDSVLNNELSLLIMFNGYPVSKEKIDSLKMTPHKKLKSVSIENKLIAKRLFQERAADVNIIINTYNLSENFNY